MRLHSLLTLDRIKPQENPYFRNLFLKHPGCVYVNWNDVNAAIALAVKGFEMLSACTRMKKQTRRDWNHFCLNETVLMLKEQNTEEISFRASKNLKNDFNARVKVSIVIVLRTYTFVLESDQCLECITSD